MTTNLMSPLLWQSVPFKDNDAWLDFVGVHEQWHIILAGQTKTRRVPLDDLRDNLTAHDLMHKDLGLALSAGEELHVPLAMTALARQLYAMTQARGYGRKDFSAVMKMLGTFVEGNDA